jgi:hypothetical protein
MCDDRAASVASAVRWFWADPDRIRSELTQDAIVVLDEWGPRIRAGAVEWAERYFDAGCPIIGPREGAAFVVIFHWNRGALPAVTQAVVAAALADRLARP